MLSNIMIIYVIYKLELDKSKFYKLITLSAFLISFSIIITNIFKISYTSYNFNLISFNILDWFDENDTQELPCGVYEVDEISYKAPPRTLEIKATNSAGSRSREFTIKVVDQKIKVGDQKVPWKSSYTTSVKKGSTSRGTWKVKLNVKNGTSKVLAMMPASVVLPTPGGPHRMNEAIRFCSIIRRITAPSPTRCFCPIYSSNVCGRNLSANGCMGHYILSR